MAKVIDVTKLNQLLDGFLTLNRQQGDSQKTAGVKGTIDYIGIVVEMSLCDPDEPKKAVEVKA